ncbi:MAG: hypothetical protein PsegKO_36160 [Pseudohongiellaceae bacterium]
MAMDNHTIRLGAAMLLATILGSYLFAASADASDIQHLSRINGSIDIDAGQNVGDVSTINGKVRISRDASAGSIDTINGGIAIHPGASITRAESVNGGIRIDRDVRVAESLKTVNGGIHTGPGSSVGSDIKTLNGKIELRNSRIVGDVQSANGDIELRDGTVVEGDIIIRGKRSWLGRLFSFGNHQLSELEVDADSTVLGDVHLYREVELRISDDAQVGDIIRHY